MEFDDIELIALRDVWFTRMRQPGVSEDFRMRRIFREYSQKFHTPLHEVYELPMEFVVQAWIEEIYEDFKDEDLLAEVQSLLKTRDQVLAERKAEDADDAEMWLMEGDIKKSELAAKKIEDAVKALGQVTSLFGRGATHEEKKAGMKLSKPAELTNVQVKPGQKIVMSFENVDLEADSFGLLSDPAPKAK